VGFFIFSQQISGYYLKYSVADLFNIHSNPSFIWSAYHLTPYSLSWWQGQMFHIKLMIPSSGHRIHLSMTGVKPRSRPVGVHMKVWNIAVTFVWRDESRAAS
jgi:hypothetical protein